MDTNAASAPRLAIRLICGAFLAALFAVSLSPSFAHADELDDAWADLNAKTAELEGLTDQLGAAREKVDACQAELESIAGSIVESQEKLSVVQQRFAVVSRMLYKVDELSILQILSTSSTIDELIGRIFQFEAIGTQAANLAEQEKKAQASLAADYDAVSLRKDEAEAAEEELVQTQAALEASASALEERIAELEEEKALAEAAAAAAAALEAAAEAARQAAQVQDTTIYNAAIDTEGASEVPVLDLDDSPVSVEGVQQEPAQDSMQETQAETQPETSAQSHPSGDTSGWSTGLASAYGGSSDASTPNPGTTATGALCDDYSVGVAVPLAWGPAAYYGRMVEISYNGMTVVATVNDCGGMGGGSRSLDLQPGVFKAFGFSTCQDWGVREVQYRFL